MIQRVIATGFDQGLAPYLKSAFKANGLTCDFVLAPEHSNPTGICRDLKSRFDEAMRKHRAGICVMMLPNVFSQTNALCQKKGNGRANASCEFPESMVTEYLTYCVEACSRQKAKPRLVLISSAKVYGHVLHVPISEHITAKPEDESAAQLTSWEFHTIQTMRQFGIRGAVARLFEVYGPGITSGTAYQLAELSDSRRRSPQHVEFVKDDERDWIHAVDAAAAVARIATTCPIDEDPDDQPHIVNVATGRSITLGTAARRLLPRTAKIKTLLKRESQQQPARRQRACIARLRRLGFQPAIPFEKGAKLFARWMRESPAQPKKRRLTTDYEHQTAYDKSPPPCIPEPGQPVAAGSPA